MALIKVSDDSGNSKTIDGTITQTATFYDNGGKLKFKSLGLQGSKKNCESAGNVAVLISDGQVFIKEKDDLDRVFARQNILMPWTFFGNNVDNNLNFLSNFNELIVLKGMLILEV